MKAIIGGKRYDTEVSIFIGKADSGEGRDDFRFWSARLYRTPRSGVYFLAGEGGPMTRFGQSAGGGMMTFGERIDVLTKSEAREWAERYLDVEIVEKEFGDTVEDA